MTDVSRKLKTVFILVRSDWRFNDNTWSGDYAYLRAYSTKEQAEAAVPGRPLNHNFGSMDQSYEVLEVEVEEHL